MGDTGHCRHGEFNLLAGCPQCIEEARAERERRAKTPIEQAIREAGRIDARVGEEIKLDGHAISEYGEPQLVKVRYYSETTGELSAREHTYYTADRLNVGDVVMVPVRDTTGKAKVSAVDVPEAEIQTFKDKVKTIPAGSMMMATIPKAKPGDDWKTIKPLGPFTGAGPYGVQEELRAEIERDINRSDGSVYAESRIDDKVVELAEIEGEDVVIEPQEFPTAVVRIAPGKDKAVVALLNEVMRIREWAAKLEVRTEDEAKMATNDLSVMSRLKKAVEEKRREYVDPLNEHVKAVNDAFKFLTGPLAEADKMARDKVTGYKLEQDRKRKEAEDVNRQAIELARKQAELNHGEFTVDVTPVKVPDVIKTTRTDVGSSSIVKKWEFEVEDFSILPDQYKLPDMVKIRKVVTAGAIIPGVKAWQETNLRIKPA